MIEAGYGDGLYGEDVYGEDYIADNPAVGSLLDRAYGSDSLVITVAGSTVPLTDAGSVTIRHGRASTDQQPDAGTCTLTVRAAALPALPTLGDPLTIELGAGAATALGLAGPALTAAQTRFTGHVTDVVARPPAGPGVEALVSLTAVTRRSRLGRALIGDVPWPQELDGDRAGRILALAAPLAGATIGTVDPGTVEVIAQDVDRRAALELLDTLAVDTGGTLVERRDGALEWHDAEHRRTTEADAALTAQQILASMVSEQRLAGLVNSLRVTYGPEVEGAERPSVLVTDLDSRSSYGPFDASISVQLADEADAQAFADLQVGRRSQPRWSLSALTVDLLRTVDTTTAAALLTLEQASLLGVTGLPESGPFSAARLWVEGWTEHVSRNAWTLSMDVSDYYLSGPPVRWVDVPLAVTWATVDPADLTWRQAVSWALADEDLGRWVDEPADRRWNTTDPALTWAAA